MVKLEQSRLSGEKVPLGSGTTTALSHGRGPRQSVGMRPPSSSFGQLRWALSPGARELSVSL